jgi:hypothetical protein
LPLAVRVLLVLTHLRTNLTTRALAVLFDTSQSAVDRIRHHLVPVLASTPRPDTSTYPWIIDGTLIPTHDQSITAVSKNYRRNVTPRSSSALTGAARSSSAAAGPVTATTSLLPAAPSHTYSSRAVLGDGGYRGIPAITDPQRDTTGHIIRDDRYRVHRRIRARVEHAIARLKDWQILRQCRRRGEAIHHSLQSSPDSGTSRPHPITGQLPSEQQ